MNQTLFVTVLITAVMLVVAALPSGRAKTSRRGNRRRCRSDPQLPALKSGGTGTSRAGTAKFINPGPIHSTL